MNPNWPHQDGKIWLENQKIQIIYLLLFIFLSQDFV
jgi:hypothetical protein